MNEPRTSSRQAESFESITAEFLARYDLPVPRYTSYPTAVEFKEDITIKDYEKLLAAASSFSSAPLSIYVHFPFCEHRCLFCGCNVIISPNKDNAIPYLGLLKRELKMVADRLSGRRRISQLHLGGGTPTYYRPDQLHDLVSHLLSLYTPTEDAELAVEVDPRVTTPEHIDVLAELGFNRISMGVQDFTPKVQEAIERVQSIEQTASIIERARLRGFGGINIDLIYGLPYQTLDTFKSSVEAVIKLRPNRLAVYSYAHVPWMRAHMKKIGLDSLPDREKKFALSRVAHDRLCASGYETIGMDHFALHDDELAGARREGRLRRNFQGYTVIPADDVIGVGISAIGDVRGAYVQNHKTISRYKQALDAGELPLERGIVRTNDDDIRRALIHTLMCNFKIDIREVEQTHNIRFSDYFEEDLRSLSHHEKEGLVTIGREEIKVTPVGEFFIRNLAMCFDRYRHKTPGQENSETFSRSV